jgi:hypothetical protein
MKKGALLLGAVGVLFAGVALADPPAGSAGTVTIYFGSDSTVFKVKQCDKDRFGVWRYAGCSNEAQKEAKREICASKKTGEHWFWSRLGEKPAKVKLKAKCPFNG